MRLELPLVSDKIGCSPETILMTKDDMIHATSEYMETEKDKVQIQMDTEDSPKKGGCRTLPVSRVSTPARPASNKGLH